MTDIPNWGMPDDINTDPDDLRDTKDEEDVFKDIQGYHKAIASEFGVRAERDQDAVTVAERILKAALPGAIATLAFLMKHSAKDADRIKAAKILADYHFMQGKKSDSDKLLEIVREVNGSTPSEYD